MPEDSLKFRTPYGPTVCLASDAILIEELMKRNRLKVVRVENTVSSFYIREPGFQQRIEIDQGERMGRFIAGEGMSSTDIVVNDATNQAVFTMWAVMLTPDNKESH